MIITVSNILLVIFTFIIVYFQVSRDNDNFVLNLFPNARDLHIPGPAFAQGFTDYKQATHPSTSDITNKVERYGPADSQLDINTPYTLLNDVLKPIQKAKTTDIGSQKCYDTNYQSKTELVGQNMAQRTNNYRHKYPDNCYGTRQEFILGFYEPKAY
jgi:hypothetical protein